MRCTISNPGQIGQGFFMFRMNGMPRAQGCAGAACSPIQPVLQSTKPPNQAKHRYAAGAGMRTTAGMQEVEQRRSSCRGAACSPIQPVLQSTKPPNQAPKQVLYHTPSVGGKSRGGYLLPGHDMNPSLGSRSRHPCRSRSWQ
jgi:hypothetical protein